MDAVTVKVNSELEESIGKRFVKEKFGVTDVVILKGIKGRKVTLAHAGRVDTFSIPIAEFQKFYKPA